MTTSSPADVATRLGSGLLSFPVTHFADDLSFDERAYRDNLDWLNQHGAVGLFAAGGTGEFFSLTPAEVERVVTAARQQTPETTPVIAPAGQGTATAIELAAAAERSGADGILLLPPYLTEVPQAGLERHADAVLSSTDLGVIVYSRANAVYTEDTLESLADRHPNLIGYKDGVGDLEQIARINARLGDRLIYIGGLPTAEAFALPYLELGATTYSSAIYNFLPEFALDFYTAVRAHDRDTVVKHLNDFVFPYTAIRDRQKGYGVSIVKAGMRAVGRSAGPVRPPLVDLTAAEYEALQALVAGRR